ncbi:MAG: biotin--[acetyl-CoA-carboxylase] ligase [Bacteroidales bacterium]|jgi:BirA family biotin operon repressor/biotin-[acetyl-CoA-carboxylase] ligase|nr:biotin--[acetyl-CoA-carboxylase] ligase [Bacteroidales bacterium]
MIQPDFKFYDVVDSTNDIAKEFIRCKSNVNGTVIQADYQLKGRGRKNSVWESKPKENLLFSIIITPQSIHPSRQFLINELVSVTLRDFLQTQIPDTPVKIKWPNDIYVENKKIAGILIEHIIIGSSIAHSIIGIGVNVNQTDFHPSLPCPTSLKNETGFHQDIKKLCVDYSCMFLHAFESWNAKKEPALTETYINHLFRLHEKHDYLIDGQKTKATIIGIDACGCLLMEMEDGGIRTFELNRIAYSL